MLRNETDAGPVARPDPAASRLPGRDFQPLLPPDPLHPLVVDRHFLEASVGLEYLESVPIQDWAAWMDDGVYEVEIAGIRHAATISRQAFYDPQNIRIRS
jgi:hypothetical protein